MGYRSIPEKLREVREAHPDSAAFRYKRDGRWIDITRTDAETRIRRIARALMALGIARGGRVGILSETRLEWVECDLGILGCGAVTVGIYPTSPPSDCAFILDHSESEVLFVEDRTQLGKIDSVRDHLPKLRRIVVFESSAADPARGILSFEELVALADSVPEEALDARQREIGPDDLASIVYTSGTTGVPKGAMLTHGSLLFVADSAADALRITPGGVYLLFLPLAHVFARLTVHLCTAKANTIAFAESMPKVGDNLRRAASFIAGVPRVYEKLRAHVLEEVRKTGGAREKIFHWALAVGLAASALEQARKPVPAGLALRRAVARRLVFRKIHARLGGRIEFMISGAAPLDKTVAEFFHACDVLVLEGIGMTENTSFSHVNRRDRFRFGTVGPLGPGIEAKIADDGELLTRGPNTMKGYFKDPQGTAQAIDPEGWLHTGDLGAIDKDGFLTITGRKKDLLVTSNGKNVAPLKVERALLSSPYIGQAIVFGDRRKFVTALLTLDPDRIRRWTAENGGSSRPLQELATSPEIVALVQGEVDAANRALAPFESVRKFRIVPGDFSIEGGEMTPTLKIRRKVVAQKYSALVEEMYRE